MAISIWVLAPGLPLVVGPPAWSSTLEIELPEAEALRIENRRGAVQVFYEDRSVCLVQAALRVYALAPGQENAARAAGETLAETLARPPAGDTAVLSTKPWHAALEAPIEAHVDYTIRLPAGFPIAIDNGHGNIRTGPGAGPLDLSASNADITVNGATGPVRIDVLTGNVRVYDAEDGARIAAINGNVALHLAQGEGIVSAANGAVVARLLTPHAGPCDLESRNGGVSVSVAPGVSAEVEARSEFGRLRCDVPLRNLDQDARTLRGRLGLGGPVLRMASQNGNVWLAPGESP